ncbi:M23 family metallopeptidase, partial [Helicobacter sp. MIT 05-5294]|uniref:M23 family metallopeptidase n=1 Tax=Helicobacter sp. MIT 05-5294 TaxID=1548150 RepID=UPI001EE7B168
MIWSIANPADKDATQTIYGRNRNGGTRKHTGRDLYTNLFDKDYKNSQSDVEIVAIADGIVPEERDFYYQTKQITILHKSFKYGKFIIRYGELDSNRILVKRGDKINRGQTIGYAGLMLNAQNIHPNIVPNKQVMMLHFEYFSDGDR